MWRASVWALVIARMLLCVSAQELRDPTRPPPTQQLNRGEVTENSNALKLQSIQFIGNQRSALINHERKYEGDRIRQYVIEKIDMNFVTLRDQQAKTTTVLHLFSMIKHSDEASGNKL